MGFPRTGQRVGQAMNSSNDSDNEGHCGKGSSGFGYELGKLLRKLRKNWFSKLNEPWPRWKRFAYAFWGALTYMLAFAMTVAGRTLFLAWMVSFRRTRAGPVRLYLAGFALPALVTLILGFSLPGFDLALPSQGAVQ